MNAPGSAVQYFLPRTACETCVQEHSLQPVRPTINCPVWFAFHIRPDSSFPGGLA